MQARIISVYISSDFDQMPPRRAQPGADADLTLRHQLAEMKRVPLEQVGRIRMTPEKLPSLVDVGVVLTGSDSHDVAQILRRMFAVHPDLGTKCSQVKFGGRGGNRETPVPKDLAALIEIIFLLPGRAAAQVRQAAAQIFVRYLGGDLTLVREVERLHHVQNFLRENAPEHPLRAFGEAVESSAPAPVSIAPESLQQLALLIQGTVKQFVRDEISVALRDLKLSPEVVQVNLNSSQRSNEDLRLINVPAPSGRNEELALARNTLLVTTYLKSKCAETTLSEVTQRRLVKSFLSIFSSTLKVRKTASTDGPIPMVGQIGRAQVHYRQCDKPLMDQVWGELSEHFRQLKARIVQENAVAAQRDARSRSPRASA